MGIISIDMPLVDGVPTPVDTAVLSDPTGSFGIRRLDTMAVVVADGQALTLVNDTYQYNFTTQEDEVEYEAYFELAYDGDVYRTQYFFGNVTGPQRTLRFIALKDGEIVEFTDPTPQLASPAATYGVKDLQTNALLVASGTSMQAEGDAGLWSYLAALDADDQRIKFSVLAVVDGVSYYVTSPRVQVKSVVLAIGRYTNSQLMGARFGVDNLYMWAGAPVHSADDGDDPVDLAAAISTAILQAENHLDEELLGAYVEEAFTVPIPQTIVDIATVLAMVRLYEARGVDDTGDGGEGGVHRMTAAKRQALKDIRRIKLGLVSLTDVGYGPSVGAPETGTDD